MPFARLLLRCALASSLLTAEGADARPALAFQEDFGQNALERWNANSAKLAIESGAAGVNRPCLRIEDGGATARHSSGWRRSRV